MVTINESYRREVMNSKNLQERLTIKGEEIDRLKRAILEKEELMGSIKS